MKLTLYPVDPTGDRPGVGRSWRPQREPEYPYSPGGEMLREARLARHLTLLQAAGLLGLRTAEVAALERGSARLDERQWACALDTLRQRSA